MSVEMRMMTPGEALGSAQTRLVDVVDSLLAHGVVLRGELCLLQRLAHGGNLSEQLLVVGRKNNHWIGTLFRFGFHLDFIRKIQRWWIFVKPLQVKLADNK